MMNATQGLLLGCILTSICLQATAAVMALRLIAVTGRMRAWICISIAISLMALRRLISLSWLFSGQPPPALELSFELVGLLTSILMLAGIALIRPLFTSIRDTEHEVRRSSEERRLLLENTRDIVYRHDPEGHFTYVSPSCEKITGYTPEQWRRHYASYFTGNPANEQAVELTEEAIRTGAEQHPYELEIFGAGGSRVWLEISERPYFENGRVAGVIGVARDITQRKAAAAERERLFGELQAALASIKTLRGFLPICSSCKKIRDDRGYWNQLEGYLREHTEAQLSHGICPECAQRLYPEYYKPPPHEA